MAVKFKFTIVNQRNLTTQHGIQNGNFYFLNKTPLNFLIRKRRNLKNSFFKGRKYEINEIKDNVVIEIFTEQEKNNYDDK